MERTFSNFSIPRKNKFLDILEFVRVWNSFLPILMVLIGFFVISNYGSLSPPVILLGLCFGLLYLGAAAVNDFFDYDVDKINMPFRPLQTKRVTKYEAKFLACIFYLGALLIALSLNLKIVLIVGATLLLSILYSSKPLALKKMGVLGTINLSVLTVFCPLYAGGVLLLNSFYIPSEILVMFLLLTVLFIFVAFLKDLKDISGDRVHLKRTLATVLGGKKVLKISLLGILIFFPLTTYYASLFFNFNILFYILSAIVFLLLIKIIARTYYRDQYYAETAFSLARILVLFYALVFLTFSVVY